MPVIGQQPQWLGNTCSRVLFGIILSWLLGALIPLSARAVEIVKYSMTPDDGVIAADGTSTSGTLTLEVESDMAATATVEGADLSAVESVQVRAGSASTLTLKADNFSTANKLYNLTLNLTGEDGSKASRSVTVVVDGSNPVPPTGLRALESDSSLVLAWDMVNENTLDPEHNVGYYRIYYADRDFAPDLLTAASGLQGINISDIADLTMIEAPFTQGWVVDGLTNGKKYWATVEAYDPADNRSGIRHEDGAFQIVSGEPVTTTSLAELAGFSDKCFLVTASLGDAHSPWLMPYRWFRDYVILSLPGGSQMVDWYYRTSPRYSGWLMRHSEWRVVARPLVWVGAIILLLMPVFLGLFFLRMTLRFRRQFAALMLTVLVWSIPAKAFDHMTWWESGAFKPDVNLQTPAGVVTYDDMYGSHVGWMNRFGWAWQITRDFGIPALGFSAGFWQRQGHPIKSESGALATRITANLTLIPISVELQYAFQYTDPQYVVPAIAVGATMWGLEEALSGADERLQNWVFGWYWRGELRFLLDWIDPSMAIQLHESTGIKHTHLVVGWRDDHGDDFGSRKQFTLNYMMVDGALLFEF